MLVWFAWVNRNVMEDWQYWVRVSEKVSAPHFVWIPEAFDSTVPSQSTNTER